MSVANTQGGIALTRVTQGLSGVGCGVWGIGCTVWVDQDHQTHQSGVGGCESCERGVEEGIVR